MFESLLDLVGGPLPDWSCTKASLPTSLGGLNICRVSLHSPSAYIGSISSTQLLVSEILGYHPSCSTQLSEAFCEFSFSSRHPEWCLPDAIDLPIQQRHLSKDIDQSTFDSFLSNAPSSCLKVLALSSAIPHAGDWLNVVPSFALGLHLHDQEFRCCLQYWLCVNMFSVSYPCSFCKSTGDHQIECSGNKDCINQPNSIRDAQSAALCPRKEEPSLIPGSKSHPADIYLPCWTHGKPAALDVSVISPLQRLTLELLKTLPCLKDTPSMLGNIANTLLTQMLAERVGFPLFHFYWRL